MSTFRITKPDNFKNYSFGKRLIDIVTALSLPTPFIKGKFHKKGIWVIHITQSTQYRWFFAILKKIGGFSNFAL
jgi:hypothetical protein